MVRHPVVPLRRPHSHRYPILRKARADLGHDFVGVGYHVRVRCQQRPVTLRVRVVCRTVGQGRLHWPVLPRARNQKPRP